jgi:hypothetical protein
MADNSWCAVSSCKTAAACALEQSTGPIRAGVSDSMIPSSSTPAVWNTAVRGWHGSTRSRSFCTAGRSVTSQVATLTVAPSSVISTASFAAPGASGPRRLTSRRCSAPLRANHRATCAPSAPVPPPSQIARGGRSWVPSWVADGLAGYQMRYLVGAGVTCVGAHGAALRS